MALAVALGLIAAVEAALTLWATVRTRAPDWRERLGAAARLGLPLMMSGLLMVWLAASGRVLLGQFLRLEDLAVYAFDMRIAQTIVLVHQIVMTALFATVFRMRARAFDRWASLYLTGTGVMSIAIALAFPLLLAHLDFRAVGPDRLGMAREILPAVSIQAFAVNVSASIELRLNRCRLAGRAAMVNTILAALFAGLVAAAGSFGTLSPETGCWLISAQWCAVLAGGFYVMARRGLPMPRMAATTVAVVLCLVAVRLFVS